MWKLDSHTKRENEAYISGRASEWAHFPVFASEIFAPFFFMVIKWYYVIIIIAILDWLWSFVRFKYINPSLSDFFWGLNRFKIIVFIGLGIYYFSQRMYWEGGVTLLWPFISIFIGMIGPRYDPQKMKELFEAKFTEVLPKDGA